MSAWHPANQTCSKGWGFAGDRCADGPFASPLHPLEVAAMFVDRHGAADVHHALRHVHLVVAGQEAIPTFRGDRVPHAHEVGRSHALGLVVRVVTLAKGRRLRVPGRVVGRRLAVSVEDRYGFLGDRKEVFRIEADRAAVGLFRWDAHQLEHVGEAADRVGPAAEAEEVDLVARPPGAHDRDVALDDLRGEPAADHLVESLVQRRAQGRSRASRRGAYARDVEGDLPVCIDARLGRRARRPEQLIDVRSILVRQQPSLVGRAVGRRGCCGRCFPDRSCRTHRFCLFAMAFRHGSPPFLFNGRWLGRLTEVTVS